MSRYWVADLSRRGGKNHGSGEGSDRTAAGMERRAAEELAMAEVNRVVVHHADGRVVKGTTADFLPSRAAFHLQPLTGHGTILIQLAALKAVFFVKDFRGNPRRSETQHFLDSPAESTHGKKVAVRFRDGEILLGYTISYSPERGGFFVHPADEHGNNLRIYIVAGATVEVHTGPAADTAAQKMLSIHGGHA